MSRHALAYATSYTSCSMASTRGFCNFAIRDRSEPRHKQPATKHLSVQKSFLLRDADFWKKALVLQTATGNCFSSSFLHDYLAFCSLWLILAFFNLWIKFLIIETTQLASIHFTSNFFTFFCVNYKVNYRWLFFYFYFPSFCVVQNWVNSNRIDHRRNR